MAAKNGKAEKGKPAAPAIERPIRLTPCRSGRPAAFAPGNTTTGELPREAIPRYVFGYMAREVDGRYVPVVKHWSRLLRLSKKMVKGLGMGLTYDTLFRLVKTGFVKGHTVAPQTTLVDMLSLAEHLDNTRADLDFWTPERRQQYWGQR
ncbi:MAG TPA: hypothetical protein PLU30_24515 [Verrucomicrobiae bacterium]|nr:hypothetical protein [Verrucomicrobiae bacterium]